MAYGPIKVALALGSQPLADSVTWTDVSAYVIGEVSFHLGRQSEFDQVNAGGASVTFNNRDRRFDPTHASGPYYGNLKPNVRIRIRTPEDTDLFVGWVRAWPQDYSNRSLPTVKVEAIDAIGMLSNVGLPPTAHAAKLLTYNPWVLYRLDEEAPRYALDSSGNDRHASFSVVTGGVGSVTKQSNPSLPLAQRSAAYFADRAELKLPNMFDGASGLGRYEVISAYVARTFPNATEAINWNTGENTTGLPPSSAYSYPIFTGSDYGIIGYSTNPSDINYRVNLFGLDDAGRPICGVQSGRKAIAKRSVADQLWHHVWIALDTVGNQIRCVIDGDTANMTTTNTTAGDRFFQTGTTIYFYTLNVGASFPVNVFGGYLSNVAFITGDNTGYWDGTVARALWTAGNGYSGQTESERVTTALDLAEWPASLRASGAYKGGPVPALESMPTSAMDMIRALARRDSGTPYVDNSGRIGFRNRHWLQTKSRSKTAQKAFVDTGGVAVPRYVDLTIAAQSEYLYNIAHAKSARSGQTFLVRDRSSVQTNGPFSIDLGELDVSDSEIGQFVKWFLQRYSAPRNRATSLLVDAKISDTQYEAMRNLVLSDRITIARTPLNVGSQTTYVQWIEGMSMAIDQSELTWTVEYNCIPAFDADLFILNTSTLNGSSVLAQ